jgi:hypothetical protein
VCTTKYKYFDTNGKPLKCRICGTEEREFVVKIENTLDQHTIMEYSVTCPTCDNMVGYWAYGNWDPAFEFGEFI